MSSIVAKAQIKKATEMKCGIESCVGAQGFFQGNAFGRTPDL